MRELHESELFFYNAKNGRKNGVLTSRFPAQVHSIKVHTTDGRIIEMFGKKVYYFKDFEILEVQLENGEERFFQYRQLKEVFIEVDKCYVHCCA